MEQGRIAYLRRKIMARDELISEKDEAIKQRDAQIKELERRRHRRFKEGDKDFRKLFDRVEALKANLKDAAEKEHDLQTYVRQLEDYIKNRDEEIERLSDRNRKIQAKHKGVDRSRQTYVKELE
jgi:chromosome segregation ATPase